MPNIKVVPSVNICPVCGNSFETGGRGRPKRSQVYCSNICGGLARVHNPKTRQMAVAEAAYLAGLIDGEGSIVAAKKRTGRTTWRLSVSNTVFELLEWCQKVTGVGSIVRFEHDNPLHSTSGTWQCYSWNAYDILRQIEPYMIIKRNKAASVIDEMGRLQHERDNRFSQG